MMEVFDFKYINTILQEEILSAIQEVIKTNDFIKGDEVKKFEHSYAQYLQIEHCISVANGTDALEMAISALHLPTDAEIIVPDCTFVATVEAVINMGLKPVIADVLDDFTINPASIKKHITKNTKAIICVHLYGHPCKMNEIMSVASEFGLYIIEDAAQAHGTKYQDQYVGTFGILGCFSFYPTKLLGAFGDAGAIVTHDLKIAEYIRSLQDHGREKNKRNNHLICGRNSKMDSLQAALLNCKLRHIEEWITYRREIALNYNRMLSGIPDLHLVTDNKQANCYQYIIRVKNRDCFVDFAQHKGITCGVNYLQLIHEMPFMEEQNSLEGFLSTKINRELVSLPIGIHITADIQQYIAKCIEEFIYRNRGFDDE